MNIINTRRIQGAYKARNDLKYYNTHLAQKESQTIPNVGPMETLAPRLSFAYDIDENAVTTSTL